MPQALHDFAGGFRPRQSGRLTGPGLHTGDVIGFCGRIAHGLGEAALLALTNVMFVGRRSVITTLVAVEEQQIGRAHV